jgi:hypothetical protein
MTGRQAVILVAGAMIVVGAFLIGLGLVMHDLNWR